MDGEPVPPRGLEAVRDEVAGTIADGAVLMMIPYVQDRRRVVRVNLSLEKGFLDTLDEAARSARAPKRSAGRLVAAVVRAEPHKTATFPQIAATSRGTLAHRRSCLRSRARIKLFETTIAHSRNFVRYIWP